MTNVVRYSLGLTGGLIAVLKDDVSDTVLDKYAQLRRDIFLRVADPTTRGNIRQLFENDPETCRETDPFFRSLAAASSSERQRIRGMQDLAVDMKGVIEAAKRKDNNSKRTRRVSTVL